MFAKIRSSCLQAFAVLLLSGLPLSAETWRAVYSDFPPMSQTTEDGTPIGFAIELARVVARQAGADVEFIRVKNPAEALALIQSGGADFHPHLVPTDERKTLLDFTRSHEAARIFAYRHEEAEVGNTETFEGARIGVVGGSVNERAAAEFPLATTIAMPSYGDLFAALLEGELDILFVPELAFERYAKTFGLDSVTTARPLPIQHRDLAFGVGKGRPDLFAALDTGLRKLLGTETYWTIHDDFLGTRKPTISRELLWKFAAYAAAVGLAGAVIGIVASGWTRDRTARKEAVSRADNERGVREQLEASHQELSKAYWDLERSNAELDQFAYIASHDLKAPLRVIDNAATWIAEDLEAHLTDDTRESIDLLKGRVRRMKALLDDLLAHSRIGRVHESEAMVTGLELVEDVKQLIDQQNGIDLIVDPAFQDIEVRQMPLKTVLLNLVGNAIKHHDRDEGRIDLDVEDRGDCFVFTVTDDGPGIPEKHHGRIFEIFQTLQVRDEVESSGVGLAIVKKYVERVGGAIRVISAGERGTAFELTWPKQDVASPEGTYNGLRMAS